MENNSKSLRTSSSTRIRTMIKIAILGAIATVLMLFEIPLFFAPSFYEIDLSEVVVLLGAFSLGPVAGVLIELVKIVLNLALNGTITAGVGELANFLIGLSLVLPASLIYQRHKSRQRALAGLCVGTVCMTIVGSLVNYFVLLPAYAFFAGFSMDAIIGMGSLVNPAIHNLGTLVAFATAPFNLLKGVLSSAILILIYKKLSPILHR